MNKFAEQFQNDVVTRYQQKITGLLKQAEESNRQDYDPRAYGSPEAAASAAVEQLIHNAPLLPDSLSEAHDGSPQYPSYSSIEGRNVNLPESVLNKATMAAGNVPTVSNNLLPNSEEIALHQYLPIGARIVKDPYAKESPVFSAKALDALRAKTEFLQENAAKIRNFLDGKQNYDPDFGKNKIMRDLVGAGKVDRELRKQTNFY